MRTTTMTMILLHLFFYYYLTTMLDIDVASYDHYDHSGDGDYYGGIVAYVVDYYAVLMLLPMMFYLLDALSI